MKTSTRSATRVGLAIAAFTLAGYAAGGLTSEQQLARAQAAPAQSPVASGNDQPCSANPSHTLLLKSPDGKAFQLLHFRGCGWKQLSIAESDVDRTRPQMSFAPISGAHAATPEQTAADPLAVFVDGPTGYTFVYTAENGWKFVGYLSDAAR
jgi:hypothetical protein